MIKYTNYSNLDVSQHRDCLCSESSFVCKYAMIYNLIQIQLCNDIIYTIYNTDIIYYIWTLYIHSTLRPAGRAVT